VTEDAADARIACGSCGAVPEEPGWARVTWTAGVESSRRTWTCPECSRRFLRSIEAKLDPELW
jgi:hypothetical protein